MSDRVQDLTNHRKVAVACKNYTDKEIKASEERILSIVARNNVDFIDHTDEPTYRFTAPANAKLLMLQSIGGNTVKLSPSVASDSTKAMIKTMPSTVYTFDGSKFEGDSEVSENLNIEDYMFKTTLHNATYSNGVVTTSTLVNYSTFGFNVAYVSSQFELANKNEKTLFKAGTYYLSFDSRLTELNDNVCNLTPVGGNVILANTYADNTRNVITPTFVARQSINSTTFSRTILSFTLSESSYIGFLFQKGTSTNPSIVEMQRFMISTSNIDYEPYFDGIHNLELSGLKVYDSDNVEQVSKTIDLSTILYNGSPLFEGNSLKGVNDVKDILTPYKATKKVGSRTYQSGDEEDTSVLTDGTTTLYELATPIEVSIDWSSTLRNIQGYSNGSIIAENTHNMDVESVITYNSIIQETLCHSITITRNGVDILTRNLPTQASDGYSAGTQRNYRVFCDDEGNAVNKRENNVDKDDLGNIDYIYSTSIFRGSLSTIKIISGTDIPNMLSKNYTTDTPNNVYNRVSDKTIASSTTTAQVWVNDTFYTDTTIFKNANTGNPLYYELADTSKTETDMDDFDYFFDVEEGDVITFNNTYAQQVYATYSFLIKEEKSNE